MIIDAIFSVILSVPNAMLDSIGDIFISVPANIFDYLSGILPYLNYFLPINALLPIIGIELAVILFKIVWAIVLRVKSFIPTMGS